MPTPYASAILTAAAERLDPERLVTVARWLRSELYSYGADVMADPETHIEVWASGNVPMPHRDTLLEGILHVERAATRAKDVLQAPTVWLLSSLWWTLHRDLPEEWLSQAAEAISRRHDSPDGFLPRPPVDMLVQLFERRSETSGVLSLHLASTAHRADRMCLYGGTLWTLAHLYWAPVVLHFQEQPDTVKRKPVTPPVALAANLLVDLREEWLPGPWHARQGHGETG